MTIILMSECACEASQMVAIVPPNDRLKSTEPSFGAVRIATPFWKARPCGSLDFIRAKCPKGSGSSWRNPCFRHAGVSQSVARNRRFRLVRSRYGCRKLPSISIPPGGVVQGEVGPYVCKTLDQSADVGVAVQRRRGQP